ncbi:MAG TPA: class I SAM-dependent methyltransferase [Anaerolineales bacterium]
MQPADLFPASDFNQWADSYDKDVLQYRDTFPFAGYDHVLDQLVEWANPQAGMSVLDIGIGTGNLAARFVAKGCDVWGTDYSEAMLNKARLKLPQVRLVYHDMREPWPAQLERRFDRIVSGYTFHHLELDRKIALILDLKHDRLEPNGRVIIADLSFPSAAEMRAYADSIGEALNDEPYWIADEARAALTKAGLVVQYKQVSACAGVYRIDAA